MPANVPHETLPHASRHGKPKTIWRCETVSSGIPRYPSLPFVAHYVYWPRGAGSIAASSRRLCRRVKSCDATWLPRYAGCVFRAAVREPRLAALFAGGAVLVPVPGSCPSVDAPWAASLLARAFVEMGLAQTMWAGLQRRVAVRKSATALSGERPTVREHCESFAVASPPGQIDRIVLIDDVITRGRTLLAAAARIGAAFPHADIRAFALIRTLGFGQPVTQLIEPCCGVIRWAGGDSRREP